MLQELTPLSAVEFAVKTEEMGQIFYGKLAEKYSDNEKLKEMFALLAEDEALHEKQFRSLMEEVPEDKFVSSTDEQLQYLRAMSLSEFFMGEKGLYRKLEEIKDENDGLMRSFELEKATLQYYGAMREVMGENETIRAIIKAEKGHLMKIMRYLITDAKFRGLSDDYP